MGAKLAIFNEISAFGFKNSRFRTKVATNPDKWASQNVKAFGRKGEGDF